MLTREQSDYVVKMTRVMQIIVGCLIAGVVSFAAFAFFKQPVLEADGKPDLQIWFGIAFSATNLLLALVVPRIVASKQRDAIVDGSYLETPQIAAAPAEVGEVAPLLSLYQTKTIIGAALLEGAAFYNSYLFMSQGQFISLTMVGLLLLGLVFFFPFVGRVTSWLESELSAIQQLRQLGDT